MIFNKDALKINAENEAGVVERFLLNSVKGVPKKDGIIVGISGGIDSAVVAALSVQAVGKERVMGLVLPEKESNPISAQYAQLIIDKLGIEHKTIELT
ncbi:MAG: NAD(+) synthase, partial [candidate division Zixibacteria bacterium]|nr:NAD(+) synthase [candidate division Zixibacteria bacterium]